METILSDALERCDDEEDVFEKLIEEQTPGGLNVKVMQDLERRGLYKEFKAALDNS